jgi:hypothetical protein
MLGLACRSFVCIWEKPSEGGELYVIMRCLVSTTSHCPETSPNCNTNKRTTADHMVWTTLEVPDKFIACNDTTLLEAKRVGKFFSGKRITLTDQTLHQRENNERQNIVSSIERFSDQHMEGIPAIRSDSHAGEDGEPASTIWSCRKCLKLPTHMELA